MITKKLFIEECKRLGMEYHYSTIGSGGWATIAALGNNEMCEWSSTSDLPRIYDMENMSFQLDNTGISPCGPMIVLKSVEELRQYYDDLLTKLKEQKRTIRRKLIEEL